MYRDAPAPEPGWDEGRRAGGSLSAGPKRDIMTLRAPRPESAPTAERPC